MAHHNPNKIRPWRGGNRKNKQNRRSELERIKFKIPEKICYLGNGSFGIIKERLNSRTNRFFIRKRIQYEAADKKSEWRRDISEQVLNKFK